MVLLLVKMDILVPVPSDNDHLVLARRVIAKDADKIHDLPAFDGAVGNHRDIKGFNQMSIEQLVLNEVGRGRILASIQTPREEWISLE